MTDRPDIDEIRARLKEEDGLGAIDYAAIPGVYFRLASDAESLCDEVERLRAEVEGLRENEKIARQAFDRLKSDLRSTPQTVQLANRALDSMEADDDD